MLENSSCSSTGVKYYITGNAANFPSHLTKIQASLINLPALLVKTPFEIAALISLVMVDSQSSSCKETLGKSTPQMHAANSRHEDVKVSYFV